MNYVNDEKWEQIVSFVELPVDAPDGGKFLGEVVDDFIGETTA